MRDRLISREPGSPASRAAANRLGSVGEPSGMPPIRKGQLVWDAEKGFVRESELRAGGLTYLLVSFPNALRSRSSKTRTSKRRRTHTLRP